MEPKFLRRVDIDDYYGEQTVNISIGSEGGSDSDTIENVPLENVQGQAYEFEIEGKRVVFIGYETRS